MPTCGFVQILITLGKKAVLSMVDVILGGCLGLDGKWSTIHANTNATIPASENKINKIFGLELFLKMKPECSINSHCSSNILLRVKFHFRKQNRVQRSIRQGTRGK